MPNGEAGWGLVSTGAHSNPQCIAEGGEETENSPNNLTTTSSAYMQANKYFFWGGEGVGGGGAGWGKFSEQGNSPDPTSSQYGPHFQQKHLPFLYSHLLMLKWNH